MVLSSVISGAAASLQSTWRQQDMSHRDVETERRAVDERRRAVAEKAEQLKAVASISALLSGFAMVTITNVAFPPRMEPVLRALVGVTTAAVVGCMLVCMLTSAFLLVAIYRFDCYKKDRRFDEFWMFYCESDWKVCFNMFSIGIPLFLALLALIGWVVFIDYDTRTRVTVGAIISAIASMTCAYALFQLMYKWNGYLTSVSLTALLIFYDAISD